MTRHRTRTRTGVRTDRRAMTVRVTELLRLSSQTLMLRNNVVNDVCLVGPRLPDKVPV